MWDLRQNILRRFVELELLGYDASPFSALPLRPIAFQVTQVLQGPSLSSDPGWRRSYPFSVLTFQTASTKLTSGVGV
ncbi:hypothetical protein Nepgr_023326 [Nepenthes gracilis]|uniref:Uncharacterized protein n=1 Tax=Nepenthes gracilis TaxID=150966 RepID=A0AAD3T2U8_NEPGR|nr:hypothetical protein Nepgr_023326 [Nepenthes gracilis]